MPHLRVGFLAAQGGFAAILVALLLAPLPAQTPLISTSTRQIAYLELAHRRIPLKRDHTVAPSSHPTLKLLAELPGKALLLTDTYASRPAGLSRCQAGEEQYLRLVTLVPRPAVTFTLKIASCRDSIELADDGIQWAPQSATLTLHWLAPPPDRTDTLTLHVDGNGRLNTAP